MGEFLVAREGLGFLIIYGGQIAQLDMVMMSIVILSPSRFMRAKVAVVTLASFFSDIYAISKLVNLQR